jgi:hypothetical protein
MAKLSLKIGAFVFVTSCLFSVAHAQTVTDSTPLESGMCLPTSYAPSQVMIVPGRMELRTTPAQYKWETRHDLVTPQKIGHYVVPAAYTSVVETTQVAPETILRRELPGPVYNTVGHVFYGPPVSNVVGLPYVSWPYGSPYYVGAAGYPYIATQPQAVQSTYFVEEVIPARFKTETKRVLAKPAERVEYMIPATYRQVSYQVEVIPERRETVQVSPVYETRMVPHLNSCSTIVTILPKNGELIDDNQMKDKSIDPPVISKKKIPSGH